jgi:hypothetical protein
MQGSECDIAAALYPLTMPVYQELPDFANEHLFAGLFDLVIC